MSRAAALLALAAGLATVGCSKPYVRPHEWRGEQHALSTLAQRAASITSVRAACALTMTDPAGDSVTFDGALVVRREPGRLWLRLRAWKLGAAVFDATVRPDGVWLMVSEQAQRRMNADTPAEGVAGLDPRTLAQGWDMVMGGLFDRGTIADRPGPTFDVVHTLESGGSVTAVVDRATLTVREYRITDRDGDVRQRLALSRYREVGPAATPFPLTVRASGPEGVVEVRLEDVELNAPIDDAPFSPPRRAVKQ